MRGIRALPADGGSVPASDLFGISRADVMETLRPAIRDHALATDPEWREEVARLRRRVAKQRERRTKWRRWSSFLPTRTKTKHIEARYSDLWSIDHAIARLDLSKGDHRAIIWNGDGYWANDIGIKRVHLLYLVRIIERLRPSRVLEVGSGAGQNLLILAGIFPEVTFTGLELTQAGIAVSEEVKARAEMPEELTAFSPVPIKDPRAFQRVEFHQGSAETLPFADKSFQLTYTVQALEQMERIRARALSEIVRVTDGHVAMFEPFRDWNDSEERRERCERLGLFSAAIDDLPRCGLTPIYATDDMPSKLNYGVGLVLAESAGS